MSTDELEQLVIQFLQVFEDDGRAIQREEVAVVDLIGLFCPEPLMMLRQQVRQGETGDLLLALATDPSTQRDIPTYCRFTGQTLIQDIVLQDCQDVFCFLVQKG